MLHIAGSHMGSGCRETSRTNLKAVERDSPHHNTKQPES